MAHRWRYETAEGALTGGPEMDFEDAAEAEEWFGANWEELATQGVRQVVLMDGDTEVYGPMGLDPV